MQKRAVFFKRNPHHNKRRALTAHDSIIHHSPRKRQDLCFHFVLSLNYKRCSSFSPHSLLNNSLAV